MSVIVGGVIGIAGSLVTSVWSEQAKRKAERRSLTGAIVGEIAALLNIAERRGYVEGLRALLDEAKAGDDPNVFYLYHFSARRNPFAVYDANLSRLGILRDPLPRLVVQFYAQASSILEDITDMRENTGPVRNRQESIERLEQLLDLFNDTHALGQQIIKAAS